MSYNPHNLTSKMPPMGRISIGVVSLMLGVGLGIAAFAVGGLFIPGAIAAGLPLAALGWSLLFGQDRDGDKGIIGPVTLYVLAGMVTLGTLFGLFIGAHPGFRSGIVVAALLALAGARSKKKLDFSRAQDPRERNL